VVDSYAGVLAGVWAKLPLLRQLQLTHLPSFRGISACQQLHSLSYDCRSLPSLDLIRELAALPQFRRLLINYQSIAEHLIRMPCFLDIHSALSLDALLAIAGSSCWRQVLIVGGRRMKRTNAATAKSIALPRNLHQSSALAQLDIAYHVPRTGTKLDLYRAGLSSCGTKWLGVLDPQSEPLPEPHLLDSFRGIWRDWTTATGTKACSNNVQDDHAYFVPTQRPVSAAPAAAAAAAAASSS
jgi:hypothetical protein